MSIFKKKNGIFELSNVCRFQKYLFQEKFQQFDFLNFFVPYVPRHNFTVFIFFLPWTWKKLRKIAKNCEKLRKIAIKFTSVFYRVPGSPENKNLIFGLPMTSWSQIYGFLKTDMVSHQKKLIFLKKWTFFQKSWLPQRKTLSSILLSTQCQHLTKNNIFELSRMCWFQKHIFCT